MNGHDPCAYFKDMLTRLPTQRTRLIRQLLPVAPAAMSRFLPVMATQCDGWNRLVRLNANGWASLCNYPVESVRR
ncbi:transposase domain-containing protein [Pseudomonas gregormendelii]